MTREDLLLSVCVSAVVPLIVVIIGYIEFSKKLPSEKDSAKAEAKSDRANAERTIADASGLWLENYNRMFNLLIERDSQILQLKSQMSIKDLEIRELHNQIDRLRVQVDNLQQRGSVSVPSNSSVDIHINPSPIELFKDQSYEPVTVV